MSGLAFAIIIVEAIIIAILLIRNSTSKYDGNFVVYETDEKKTFSLELKTDPNRLDQQKDVVLRVTHPDE